MTSGRTGPAPDTPGAGGEEAGGPGEEPRQQTERVRAEAERQAERARAEARELKDDVEQAARRATGAAGERAREALTEQKAVAADQIASLAHALRASADQLERDEHGATARYLGSAAAGVERMADELRRQDLTGLMHQTERFAREQPALFMGGAVAAGFALARFLKSSAERRATDHGSVPRQPYGGPAEATPAGAPSGHAGMSTTGEEGVSHGDR